MAGFEVSINGRFWVSPEVIDLSGKRPQHLIDRRTGKEIPVELFVAVIEWLYEIEEEARGLDPDERQARHQERATPLRRELMRLKTGFVGRLRYGNPV